MTAEKPRHHKKMLRRLFSSNVVKKTAGRAGVIEKIPQAPNRVETWSKRQQPRSEAISGPRFAQIDLDAQPAPPAAIEYIKLDPVREVASRTVSCSGDGPLGHPKVFINLVTNLTSHNCR